MRNDEKLEHISSICRFQPFPATLVSNFSIQTGSLTLALMGIPLRGPPPRLVIVEGFTLLAVHTHRIVLTLTLQSVHEILITNHDTCTGVAVTLAPGQRYQIKKHIYKVLRRKFSKIFI